MDEDDELTGEQWQACGIAQSGLIHVPGGRGIFANLTVDENLQLGAYSRNDHAAIRKDPEQTLNFFPRVRERLKQFTR